MLLALDKMFSYRCGAKCLGACLFFQGMESSGRILGDLFWCDHGVWKGFGLVFDGDVLIGCWEIASSFGETMKLKIFRWLKARSTLESQQSPVIDIACFSAAPSPGKRRSMFPSPPIPSCLGPTFIFLWNMREVNVLTEATISGLREYDPVIMHTTGLNNTCHTSESIFRFILSDARSWLSQGWKHKCFFYVKI